MHARPGREVPAKLLAQSNEADLLFRDRLVLS